MKMLLLIPLLLAACTLEHTPPGPGPALPEAWATPLQDSGMLPGPWWQAYQDEVLTGLVVSAQENSPRIEEAKARVIEARGQRRSIAGDLYPQFDIGSNGARGNEGIRTFGNPNTLYEASFDASYEVDLFGGNSARRDAAEADMWVREALYEDTRLSLTAEVVREYSDYRRLQRQIKLTEDTLTSQREGLRLTRTRFAAGIASDLEVAQAESLALSTESQLPPLKQAARAGLLRLTVLTTLPVTELETRLGEAGPASLPNTTPFLAEPASILARRPDIMAAVASLQSATALSAAETTELYPSLNLSALFGVQDTTAFGGFNIWSLGAGIAAPLFNFGRIEGRIDAAQAREVAAYQAYRQSVLKAVADVETALSDLIQQRNRRAVLVHSAEADARALKLAKIRYTDGIVTFLEVLTAEQQSLKSQLSVAESEGAEAIAFAAFCKSLALH